MRIGVDFGGTKIEAIALADDGQVLVRQRVPTPAGSYTGTLRAIAELAETRDRVDEELTEAVRSARHANRSWSEIGAMLGVSKQAAQRKYGPAV